MTAVSAKLARPRASTGMRSYELGGVAVRSDIPLPGIHEAAVASARLLVKQSQSDEFRSMLGTMARPHAEAGYEQVEVASGSYIRWQQDMEFLVSNDGRQIRWRKINPELSDVALRSFTFGHVFSHALTLQGIETLHGTAAAMEGDAVAFLGNCGYGKSTLACWLLRCCLRLMTDDILVVRHGDKGPVAYPGLPQIKLMHEAAAPLFAIEQGTPMCTGSPKLIFPLAAEQYHAEAAPLGAIYLLAPPETAGEEILIEPVRGSASFVRLMENIFIDSIVDATRQKRLFALLERLCREIPVCMLSYPRRHEIMPEVVSRVQQHVHQNAPKIAPEKAR